jgi:hypothetical protein
MLRSPFAEEKKLKGLLRHLPCLVARRRLPIAAQSRHPIAAAILVAAGTAQSETCKYP